jgi:hypothetical protein
MRWRHWLIFLSVFALALWLWPNLVHEQLHRLALQAQGLDGMITYDWGFPPHPFVTPSASRRGVFGGILYLVLPSVFSIFLMILFHILLPRVKWGDWEIAGHGLILYLVFDFIENIRKYRNIGSDFYFLTAVPLGNVLAGVLMLSVSLWALWIVWVSREEWWI